MGELASKLACESFFGKELMAKRTVMGVKDYPSLPIEGLRALKETIRSISPDYQCNPVGFEAVWKNA